MLDLAKSAVAVIVDVLEKYVPDYEARAFGSRVNGAAREFADLDLVLFGREKLDWRRLEELKDAFSESDLPIIVDILDWHALSDQFREIIQERYEVLRRPTNH